MHPVKIGIIAAGVALVMLGYECTPHGQSLIADHFSSSFAQLSDAGTFSSYGVRLMIAGVGIFAIGLLLPLKW